MNHESVPLHQVIDGLRSEGLLPEDSADAIASIIESMHDVQPWYIRTMVGFGAWLASLLLIGFVGSIGFAADTGFVFVGLFFIGGAIFARKKSANDFMVQSALACSLAGQALLAVGIVEISGSAEFEGVLGIVIVLNVVLFFVFPDRVHRVLSILIVASSLGVLLFIWELNMLVPVIGPAFAALMVFFYYRQGLLVETGKGHLLRPLVTGLMIAAFGFLLLSTVYVLPESLNDIVFYPRPWISTILLGALFIVMGTKVWPQLGENTGALEITIFYGFLLLIITAAWSIPGLLLALIVIMLGASSGNRVFVGAGVTFLGVFIAAYFYGIQLSMLTKSITLVATGTAVLVARWILLKVLTRQVDGGTSDV